ncbi:MAG: DegT/DnrJ/EryC1/StrS aminotransferase family protein [Magnetococcales bacterium]|nr:DegT/DnrJ/EryC1/StrS aminotransferase family protein [Magnetococcales bacterium]MBF0113581.1 DegT/DnrJ/EryC1/StrS aminotransferase family protein [Magnetococcales bacterium]
MVCRRTFYRERIGIGLRVGVMHGKREEVLLWQAELGQAELQAVRQQLAQGSFLPDQALLRQWEARWQQEWQCPALAFADAQELVRALRLVLGWPAGAAFALDPLLDPVWGEAVRAEGLLPCWPDLDPESGALQGCARDAEGGQVAEVRVQLLAAGDLAWREPCQQGLPISDISARPMRVPVGAGCTGLQVYHGGGQQWLAAGDSVLLMGSDGALLAALRQVRRRLPSALACALGLAQWASLPQRWQRRQALRARYYDLLRGHGHWQMPLLWERDRCWPLYALRLPSQTARQALQGYLQRAAIATAAPFWFTLPAGAVYWPGWCRYNAERLALPLHAALSDAVQKRIINRLNRWSGLQVAARPVGEQ